MRMLTPLLRRAFREREYVAVYVEGPDRPIPRKFGDNQGGWPVRVGITSSWTDKVTKESNRHTPYHWQGCLFRVWTEGKHNAHRLKAAIERLIQSRAEHIKMNWLDLGHELDLDIFEFECHDVGKRQGIKCWDDEGLVMRLRRQTDASIQRLLDPFS